MIREWSQASVMTEGTLDDYPKHSQANQLLPSPHEMPEKASFCRESIFVGSPSLSAHWLGDNLQWATEASGLSQVEGGHHMSPSGHCEHVCYAFSKLSTFLSSLLASLPRDLSPQWTPRRVHLGIGDSEAGRTGGQLDAVDQSPGFGERQSRKKSQLLSGSWARGFTSVSLPFLILKTEIWLSASHVGASFSQ